MGSWLRPGGRSHVAKGVAVSQTPTISRLSNESNSCAGQANGVAARILFMNKKMKILIAYDGSDSAAAPDAPEPPVLGPQAITTDGWVRKGFGFFQATCFGYRPEKRRKEMRVMESTTVKEATIFITKLDRQRLEKLIEVGRERDGVANHEYLHKLEQELDKAETVASENVPGDVITMRSRVRLSDLNTGGEVVYTLVFPTEADFSEGKISVLAPIGTAMLGYREGSVIEWYVPSGLRRLKVEEILYQPEAAGDYNL